jgi:indole-3-glycerol phosphate synthase
MQGSYMGTVLGRIVAQTADDLERRKSLLPLHELESRLATAPAPVDIRAALDQQTVTVIAEVKRASPSRGRFPVEVDAANVAEAYIAGGASMISCLTDEPFFQGSLGDLDAVVSTSNSGESRVGVLRKDFFIDPYQIVEARVHGASCILLIVACLSDTLLEELYAQTQELGMEALIEVHDEDELGRALAVTPRLVGINNRNLKTLAVDLIVTERLSPLVPREVLLAGESGIFTRGDVQRMAQVGTDAVLVGESLIVQPDRAEAVRGLVGIEKRVRA